MEYVEYAASDFDEFLGMGQKLWTELDEGVLERKLSRVAQSEKYKVLLAKDSTGKCTGFSIFSIRTDYVEGSENSPTGYLEGIFVEAEFRKMGIANDFVRRGEVWCKEKGCTQLGSDTWQTATKSREFHKRLGFREEDELVHFLKDLE